MVEEREFFPREAEGPFQSAGGPVDSYLASLVRGMAVESEAGNDSIVELDVDRLPIDDVVITEVDATAIGPGS